MNSLREIPDEVLALACELILEGKKTPAVRDAVNQKLLDLNVDYSVSREQVYALLGLARERRYFYFSPAPELKAKQRIADVYQVPRDSVHVAASSRLDHVAASAADLVVDLIGRIGEHKPNVHVGLGGGWTSMLVANHLATRLRSVDNLPELTFHALSSGFDPYRPLTAPVTFFGFFNGIDTKIDFVGLFAPPVAARDDYARVIRSAGVKESFDVKDEIDIVLTSLGSASHGHGDFARFMSLGKKRDVNVLKKAGWRGDVQYRAFGADGPITAETEIRAVSLLELDELVEMASKPQKHVVVVAGPCRTCGESRSDAVRPLFQEKSLRVWSHFVMDVYTANDLLD